jgi:hypothetical protein
MKKYLNACVFTLLLFAGICTTAISLAEEVQTLAQLVEQSKTLESQAEQLLRGNPVTKNYFQAADLYHKAGYLLDLAVRQYPADTSSAQLQQHAKKLHFEGGGAQHNGINRQTRGLL